MNNNAVYVISDWTGLLRHSSNRQPLARDIQEDELLMRARVRSGDYFSTLATEIEKVAVALQKVRPNEATELERLANELLVVHRKYKVVEK